MSAGKGIMHSELNASSIDDVNLNLIQIWVFPKGRNIEPRYDQKRFGCDLILNKSRLLFHLLRTRARCG